MVIEIDKNLDDSNPLEVGREDWTRMMIMTNLSVDEKNGSAAARVYMENLMPRLGGLGGC